MSLLGGTRLNHDSTSFRLIEIIDSLHITFIAFSDRLKSIGDTSDTSYWYYKSKAKMGYWDQHSIRIGTDRYRFDYTIHGDTLIEFDKMGEQGKFTRVHADND